MLVCYSMLVHYSMLVCCSGDVVRFADRAEGCN